MNLNAENAERYTNLYVFAVQARIKGRVPRAENRKATSFFPRSHQRVPALITVSGAARRRRADPMEASPEPGNGFRP